MTSTYVLIYADVYLRSYRQIRELEEEVIRETAKANISRPIIFLDINSYTIMDLGPVLDLDIPVMDSFSIIIVMEVILILIIKSIVIFKNPGIKRY
ncbi:MAG: hypothetical protein ACMUHX_07980 [bacterium]